MVEHGHRSAARRCAKSNSKLDSRKAREKLKARGMPYYRKIESGLAVGYRKLRGQAGTWWCRHYVGEKKYDVEKPRHRRRYSLTHLQAATRTTIP